MLLCYSLLQCKCGKLVGVSVHSSDGGEDLKSLNGKVSIFFSWMHVFMKWNTSIQHVLHLTNYCGIHNCRLILHGFGRQLNVKLHRLYILLFLDIEQLKESTLYN